MPFYRYFAKNNAQGIVLNDTSSQITFGSGHTLPIDVSSGEFLLTLGGPGGEIVKVTNASQDGSGILTVDVTRALEDSSYLDATSGTIGYLYLTAGMFNNAFDILEQNDIKLLKMDVTGSVDLDQIEADTVTNNAKVTNANHTGDVTGSGILGIVPAAISGRTTVTPVTGDYILIWDATDSTLKKVDASNFLNLVTSVNGLSGVVNLVTGDISDTISTQKYTTAADITKMGYISVTQAVDLDTIESDTTTNNAKVTNATHTGDVTGSGVLGIVPAAISGRTGVTPVAGDYVLLWDATDSTLKKANVNTFIGGDVTGPGSSTQYNIALFSDDSGKLIEASTVSIDPSGHITGASTINADYSITIGSNITASNSYLSITADTAYNKNIRFVSDVLYTWVVGSYSDTHFKVERFDNIGESLDFPLIIDSTTGNITTTGTINGRNISTDGTKLDLIDVTGSVNLDTIKSDTTTNNAKVTNATHTGDVTGSGVLGIVPAAISGRTGVTPVAGDYILLWDATDSLLKKVDASNFLFAGAGGDVTGPASSTNTGIAIFNGTGGKTLMNSLVTIDTSSVTVPGFLSITGQARNTAQTALSTSGIVTWNLNNSPKANIILAGDVTSVTFSGINLNTEGTLYIQQNASTAYSIDWPLSLVWANGSTPDLTELSSKHIVSFYSYDGTGLIGAYISSTFYSGGGAVDSVNTFTGAVTLVTGNISDTTSTQKYTTAADITKMGYISVTQAVDLDTIESDTATNNAKVTNATHTGDVTGSGVLGIVPAAISGRTAVTPVSTDYLLLWDATDSLLKKCDASNFLSAGAGGDVTGPASSTNTGIAIYNGTGGKTLMNSLVTVDTSSVTVPGFLTVTGQARYSTQTTLATSGTITWNINNEPVGKIALAGNVTALTISGININSEATLYVTQNASSAYTITWPGTVIWAGGTAPDLSVLSSKHIVSFYSYDGTNLFGAHVSDSTATMVTSVNGFSSAVTLVTGNISDTTSTQKYTTAANLTKIGYISVTQAVDLDTIESDTTTNNAKVTNATHTGDVTGSGVLGIVPAAISGRTGVTAVAGDYVLLWDATDSLLKKADVTDFISAVTASSTTTFTNKRITKRVTTLTDAATIAINCDNMDMGRVTLTASRTLGTPTGTPTDGQPLLIEVEQGGTGSYTLTASSVVTAGSYRFGADVTGFVLSTAVGKKDLILLTYLSDITGWAVVSMSKGYPA